MEHVSVPVDLNTGTIAPPQSACSRFMRGDTKLQSRSITSRGTATPLGLDLSTSDLDVLCHAYNPDASAAALWSAFSDEANF